MPLTASCLICDKPIITNDEVLIAFYGLAYEGFTKIKFDILNDEELPPCYYVHEACARPKESK